mgnify:CR=1 FL=1
MTSVQLTSTFWAQRSLTVLMFSCKASTPSRRNTNHIFNARNLLDRGICMCCKHGYIFQLCEVGWGMATVELRELKICCCRPKERTFLFATISAYGGLIACKLILHGNRWHHRHVGAAVPEDPQRRHRRWDDSLSSTWQSSRGLPASTCVD